MNEKLLALKKKLTDNKTVVIAATATGVAAAGFTAFAMHKHYDNKILLEVTKDGVRRLRAGYVGIFHVEGMDLILMRDPNQP